MSDQEQQPPQAPAEPVPQAQAQPQPQVQQPQPQPQPQPQQQANPPPRGRKPEFAAYSVQDTRDGKGFWNRIGAAWEHKDYQGMDVQLDSMPINGRVTLRKQVDQRRQEMKEYEEERAAQGQGPFRPDQGQGYGR